MKERFKLITFFINPYKKDGIILTIAFILNAILQAISIGSLYPFLNSIFNQRPLAGSSGMLLEMIETVAKIIPIEDQIISSAVFAITITLLSTFCNLALDLFISHKQLHIEKQYKSKIFKALFLRPLPFFKNKTTGECNYITSTASESVGDLFFFIPKFVVELMRFLALFFFMLSINGHLTTSILLLIVSLSVVYLFIGRKLSYPIALKTQHEATKALSITAETFLGIKQVKIFLLNKFFHDRYNDHIERSRQLLTRSAIIHLVPQPIVKALIFTVLLIVVIFIRQQHPSHFLAIIPIMAVYFISLQKIIPSILSIGGSILSLAKITPDLELVQKNITPAPKQRDLPCKEFTQLEQKISISNLSFSYDSTKPVLQNINLSIGAKMLTIIDGPSGAGKSTLAATVMRLLTIEEGSIQLDNHDLNSFTEESWRSLAIMVSQSVYLFSISILENITLARSDISQEEVVKICCQIGADSFIQTLSQGYNTVLGDGGEQLSGGEAQKIALARALIVKPKLLILDEATNALDQQSVDKIYKHLTTLKKDMTIISITHDQSLANYADLRVTMHAGTITSTDTPHSSQSSH